jgi:beta-glucosidase-like glycosyl hydrolase
MTYEPVDQPRWADERSGEAEHGSAEDTNSWRDPARDALADADTSYLPVLPGRVASEQPSAHTPSAEPPRAGDDSLQNDSVAEAETRPLSTPGQDAIAEAETRQLPALRRHQPPLADEETLIMPVWFRHTPGGSASDVSTGRWKRRLTQVAIVVALLLFGARAAYASLGLMSPGGNIVGWSRIPTVTHPFVSVPTTTTQRPLTASEYAALLVPKMSLDDELGQMMIVQFVGTDVNPDLVKMIGAQGAGGVLFFGGNIQTADQVRSLTANLQQLASIPLLMAVDQEGGYVNRFRPILGPIPGAATLQTPADAQARGEQDAVFLHDFGFNLNLAPVVDVGTSNSQLYGRTFGSSPDRVAAMAGAYIAGLQASGYVTAVPKHFPGLGATTTDPHVGMPTLNRSRADWEAIDVAPYVTLLKEQDVRAIMVSHEMIPAVDPNLPTSLSPAVLDGTLRGELGFNGVAITDDLVSMDAITARWSVPQASALAIKAGSDIVTAPNLPNLVQGVKDAIKQAIQNGDLTRAHIDSSVQRILTLKISMGLIPLPQSTTVSPTATPQGSIPAVAWRRDDAPGRLHT